jgi:fructoselysine-6-P-deglycase FrlB-like protein
MKSIRSEANHRNVAQQTGRVECLYECTTHAEPRLSTHVVRISHSGTSPETIATESSLCVLKSCRRIPDQFIEDPI